jgi:hypothetical protein
MLDIHRKRDRLWYWACNRGFAFLAYLLFAASALFLYHSVNFWTETIDKYTAIVAGFVSLTLVASGLASAHAVVYGIRWCNAFLIKLELPSLRILAIVFLIHGGFAIYADRIANGLLQFGVAALLFHEMRKLSVLRKGAQGGLI